jgi:uncharacterized protein (DUF3084 family)
MIKTLKEEEEELNRLRAEIERDEDIQKRLDLLLSAAQFRARSAGVLGTIQIEDGRLTQLIEFIAKVQKSPELIDEIKVVASEDTYTVGPLKLHLIALKDGEIVFSS